MLKFFILAALLLNFAWISNSSVRTTADLAIISYQPLKFNLSFTKSLALPKFQLLFHQIPISFQVQGNLTQSQFFILKAQTENIVNQDEYITQKYTVMFNQPLQIDEGNLASSSFVLRAHRSRKQVKYVIQSIEDKSSHFRFQNFDVSLNSLALVICLLAYIFAYTTVIGINLFSFLATYAYLALQSPLFTTLDYRLAFYFLFEVRQLDQSCTSSMPHILVVSTLIIGLASRKLLKERSQHSGICFYVYYSLSYKLMIITWQIMFVPIFANTVQLIRQYNSYFSDFGAVVKLLLIYYSIVSMIFYIYMTYFAANPQIGQSQEKWQLYTKSEHFQHFEGFHFGINFKDWKKRNFKFIIAILRVAMVLLVTFPIANIACIFVQILLISYISSVKPFKHEFFNTCNISIQTAVLILYVYRYISELYIAIGQDVATSYDINRILLANIIFISIIVFMYFFFGFFQLLFRIKMLKNKIKQFKYQLNFSKKQFKQFRKKNNDFDPFSQKQGNQDNNIKKLVIKKEKLKMQKNEDEKKETKEIKQQESESSEGRNLTQKKQKWNSRLKQKSSLLQSLSLSIQKSE